MSLLRRRFHAFRKVIAAKGNEFAALSSVSTHPCGVMRTFNWASSRKRDASEHQKDPKDTHKDRLYTGPYRIVLRSVSFPGTLFVANSVNGIGGVQGAVHRSVLARKGVQNGSKRDAVLCRFTGKREGKRPFFSPFRNPCRTQRDEVRSSRPRFY